MNHKDIIKNYDNFTLDNKNTSHLYWPSLHKMSRSNSSYVEHYHVNTLPHFATEASAFYLNCFVWHKVIICMSLFEFLSKKWEYIYTTCTISPVAAAFNLFMLHTAYRPWHANFVFCMDMLRPCCFWTLHRSSVQQATEWGWKVTEEKKTPCSINNHLTSLLSSKVLLWTSTVLSKRLPINICH